MVVDGDLESARTVVAEKSKDSVLVNPEKVRELLGVKKFRQQLAAEASEVGLATGLAWTEVGGEVLLTEATTMDGKGELRCVKLSTGEQLWTSYAATTGGERGAHSACAFLVKNGDRFFLASETGDLIIARLTPEQYSEVSRAKIMAPTGVAFGRSVWWSHPAFANRCLFARNDNELVCYSLAAD